ncbi:MAG: neutral zinc metallopeptidase [Fimbriimonadaceae bacterium]|nr:neutral zinc metallopeptidase [Fimbriimonadaceae bacterium]
MRWKGRDQSDQIEDRRGALRAGPAVGGGAVLLIALVVLLLGGNPQQVLNQLESGGDSRPVSRSAPSAAEEELREFTAVVLKDTEDVWTDVFKESGRTYRKPKLVLFSGQVDSACGSASSAVGPFYCGEDERIYIDLSFYGELKSRFGARGEFAQAYVIAHEVGHHVQKLLGTLDKVHVARSRMRERGANAISVRLELQADYYAGLFARRAQATKNILDKGDIDSAISAATAIGDDTLQRKMQGQVVPDSFTHGTSDQRVRWFLKGWERGDLEGGDTFRARSL